MATAVNATLLAAADDAGEAAYADAHADAVVGGLDAGAAVGYVEIRKGAAPAVGSAATGDLIVSIDLNDPAFGAAGASTTGQAAADTDPALSGTAVAAEADVDSNGAWFRALDSNDTVVMQGDAAFTDAGEEMILSANTIDIGDTVTITNWTFTTTGTTS